ncbi:MAG: hypothetical protein HKP58_02270 [Desulfatitalea sp.]|nr:hypothetical protein [Desulfatitalea sp.]NNJ99214.1 hypothetical protein [Desulfatitalea sp.]
MEKSILKAVCVLLCSAVFMLSVVTSHAGYEDIEGGFDAIVIAETGSDWNQDGTDDFYVFHPSIMNNNSHPIIVLCVGTGRSPDDGDYRPLLESFATHGFVVIAGTDGDQQDGDQALCGLNWLIDENDNPGSIFYNKLVINKIVSMGNSQGGSACIHVALKDERVTAVISMMPGAGYVNGGTTPVYENINVPIFWVSAQWDFIIWPRTVVDKYNRTNSPAWYGCHLRSGHFSVPETMQIVLRAWLYTHLYDDPAASAEFYGDNWTFQHNQNWEDQRRKNVD